MNFELRNLEDIICPDSWQSPVSLRITQDDLIKENVRHPIMINSNGVIVDRGTLFVTAKRMGIKQLWVGVLKTKPPKIKIKKGHIR